MPEPTLLRPGDFIDGRFVSPAPIDGELAVHSPADQNDRVSLHPFGLSHVDPAVQSARVALRGWRRTPATERRSLLQRYRSRLRANRLVIAETIMREAGKPRWEAEGEVSAMIGKVGLCLGEAAELTATRVLSDLPGEIRYRPLGVIAVVGPFNFPGHLPNGQIVPALLLGNTVVHKPSEKTPSTGTWMARCFEEAGLPSGVFNLVQGPAPVAVALVQHPDLDAILFTGSAAVGKRIVQANIERPERLIALELGGKNASIVLDDCDIEAAARQIAFAGYVTAGQRCSATSRVIATQRVAERLRKRIGDIASRIHVGYPGDPDVFMGPMISKEARAALADVGRRAEAHGFEPAPAGGELSVEGRNGWYVRPSLHLAPNPNAIFPGYTDEELFGPDMVLYTVSDLDEAIELANATRYGLVASVYTGSRERFEQAANELDTGVLHWNRSTAGASGRLPFGGIKQSGNHRPAGLTTGLSCSYAQGVLLAPRQEPLASWPGFNADSRLGS